MLATHVQMVCVPMASIYIPVPVMLDGLASTATLVSSFLSHSLDVKKRYPTSSVILLAVRCEESVSK